MRDPEPRTEPKEGLDYFDEDKERAKEERAEREIDREQERRAWEKTKPDMKARRKMMQRMFLK